MSSITVTYRTPFVGVVTVFVNTLSQNMNDVVNQIYADIERTGASQRGDAKKVMAAFPEFLAQAQRNVSR